VHTVNLMVRAAHPTQEHVRDVR